MNRINFNHLTAAFHRRRPKRTKNAGKSTAAEANPQIFKRGKEERVTSPSELIVTQCAEMFQTASRLDVRNRVADWKCVSGPDA